MDVINSIAIFDCPKCGEIPKENIKLYNMELRKQNFNISPILPICLNCGSEVIQNTKNTYNSDGKVIVLTGTCASGKSATAEILMQKYGFEVIDGDCVVQVVKHKLRINKIEYNDPQMYVEIANQIDILLSLKKNIVISHVITVADIDIYHKMFKNRKLNYKIFLLHPNLESAITRSKARTCHKSITPEEWVKYFHNKLSEFKEMNNNDVIIFDNSDYSLEESADRIVELFNGRANV